MKNQVLAAMLCAALALQMTACGAEKTAPEGASESQPPTSGTAAESTASDTPSAAPSDHADETLAQVAQAAREPVSAALGAHPWYDMTPEEKTAILDAAASVGAAVTLSTDRSAGIRGYEKLAEFCMTVQVGQDGSAAYYGIDEDGVTENAFTAKDGKLTYSYRYRPFAGEGTDAEFSDVTELESVELWDNGWLVWKPAAQEGMEPSWEGVRAAPLPAEYKELMERYILPVMRPQTGVLSRSWDADHLERVNWNYAFENLLWAQKGENMMKYNPDMAYDDAGPVQVPAAEVEGLLTAHFPIAAERLRTLPAYDAQTQTYAFYAFQGGGYSPQAEVTGKTDNPDGSITIRVDWVAVELGVPSVRVDELTVMPGADGGWRCVSNKTNGEDGDKAAPYGEENSAGVLPA